MTHCKTHVPPTTHRGITLKTCTKLLRAGWAKHVVMRLIDSVLIPLTLFNAGNRLGNIWVGLSMLSAYSWGIVWWRHKRNEESAMLLATAIRSAIMLIVGFSFTSPGLWALQGAIATGVGGLLIAMSSVRQHPFVGKLIDDLLPSVRETLGKEPLEKISKKLGFLWGGEQILLALLNTLLLQTVSFGMFLWLRILLGWLLAAPTLVVSAKLLASTLEVTASETIAWGSNNTLNTPPKPTDLPVTGRKTQARWESGTKIGVLVNG